MTDGAIIVTGGSGEIGAAICARAAADGYDVFNLDIGAPRPGSVGRWCQIDLADAASAKTVLAGIVAEAPVLRLVNCAGMIRPASLDDTSVDDFDAVIALNLRAAMLCAQAVAPGMRRAGFGRIVSISSRASLGKHLRTAYAASKAALHGMTCTWALELAKDRITVNCVAPGPIATTVFWKNNPPQSDYTKKLVASIPLGRMGLPEDVANAVSFFCDDRAGFVTGQTLFVCGGVTVG